jgi:hypothetical protein
MARRRKSSPGPYLSHVQLLRDRIPDPGQFPYNLPAVRHLDTLTFHPKSQAARRNLDSSRKMT